MLLIRRFEEKAGQLYGMGLIGGFCHLYIGQEAVVVGLEAAAQKGDKRVTTYRDHGHMLACGMEPAGVMAELTGRAGGYSQGKGGSMHMFSREKDFYGAMALSVRMCRSAPGWPFRISITVPTTSPSPISATAPANQGQVYRDLQHGQPVEAAVIFVIENNLYAMGTSQRRSTSTDDIYTRGKPLASRANWSTGWMC